MLVIHSTLNIQYIQRKNEHGFVSVLLRIVIAAVNLWTATRKLSSKFCFLLYICISFNGDLTYSGVYHVGITREEHTGYPHKYAALGSYKGLPFVTSGGPLIDGHYIRQTEIFNDQLPDTNWILLADYPFAND